MGPCLGLGVLAAAKADAAKSRLALRRLDRPGLGVPQDDVHAHRWFNLAASRGEAEAAIERDALAARLAPEHATA